MFPDVDTRDAAAVASRIRRYASGAYPEADLSFFDRVFDMVKQMFEGEFEGLSAADLGYHDYQHTLQASLCMAELLANRQTAGTSPALTWRQYELGMAAVLMHDCGYLKSSADGDGTGAKYTYAHVLRSCAAAASLLPRVGLTLREVTTVLGAIRCTGPDSDIKKLHFDSEADFLLGACVATSDYLGQLAAEDYPDELEILYNEFNESDDYLNVPLEKRMFKSVEELIAKTPGFWQYVVRPKLDSDFRGIYQFLATPYPDGPNRYLEAIEHNMTIIAAKSVPAATGN